MKEIYFMYIHITVEINRWLKGKHFAVLHVYNTQKKRDLCFKGHIFIFIQEVLWFKETSCCFYLCKLVGKYLLDI